MKNFNQGGAKRFGNSRGGSRFGSERRFSSNDRGPVTMHKATCSECGNSCEVPFRPTGEKPIFCNDCFSSKRDDSRDSRPRRDFSPRPSEHSSSHLEEEVKKQIEFLGLKIERLTKAVEALTETKKATPSPEQKVEVKKAIKKALVPSRASKPKTVSKAKKVAKAKK